MGSELLLCSFLEVLFNRLASPGLLQFARQEGLGKHLDKWSKWLTRIREALDDAEEKSTERLVKFWLDDLRDWIYDMEDILDELATEAALQRNKSHASTSKVWNLVPSWFPAVTPSGVKIKFRLRSKIEEINIRFNDLVAQKDQLNLKEKSTPRPSKRREIPPSTSVVTEDHIYGRQEVAEAVLQLLISDKLPHAPIKVNVIPIVGMGGIGKTTLAQLVYNNEKVGSFFDLKAWVCVSDDFDVFRVTKTLLQSVASENCDGKDLSWLQVRLKEKLFGKRFLVILDDVWNENYNDWVVLRAPFEVGAPGSSIIVTTRNHRVSSMMGNINVSPFQLDLLPTDACLSIFSQHALDAKDFSAHPNLRDMGVEIVRRCKGLPLAVKTVGGLLRGTQDRNEWEKVLKNEIWDIPDERSNIAPALMLSYHHLPSHLKRCFAYCSILPKDYEFQEKELILLWMAEGLIQPRQDEEEMEDLGRVYFRNLLAWSFFKQSSIDKSRFLMHDLINDLALSVAGETCFRMEDRAGDSWHGNLPYIKARHSSYLGSQYDVAKKYEVFYKLTSLRTFLPLMLPQSGECYLARCVLFELVSSLHYLRVLSFNGYYITELSDSIGNLKHLRYIDLSKTQIRVLPESITSLYNLQTLLLENCIRLKKLPPMLCNLVNLRHLNIEGASFKGMPVQIGKLTCLQTLSNLVLGEDNCSGIKELGPLKHLRGKLCISRLENVIEPEDAKDAKLIEKNKISALSLEWSASIDESRKGTSELEVLNGLQPQRALTELCITGYGGSKFPYWLTPSSVPHLVSLTISYCRKCTLLPPLGQFPSLKTLSIFGMDSVKSIGSEFCGNSCAQCFRSLETLKFCNMQEWKNWSPCEEFPNLRELSLIMCPKLLGNLPNNLPLLNKAQIYNCDLLVVSLSCFPDKCEFNIEESRGVVCGSKVTFKSMTFSRSLSPISDEGLDMEGLAELERLTIKNCKELANLWSDNMGSLPHLPFLHGLDIYNCPKLVSLVAEEVDQERPQLGLPSLPKALMYNNTPLEYIHISFCDSLTHFARSHLPPTLKTLRIGDCKSMRNLVEDGDNDTNNSSCSSGIKSLLEVLEVSNCPSLEFLTSSGELPTTLQRLEIGKCPKLESVAKSFHHNSFLGAIIISDCEKLQLLNGGELLLPSNLRELSIFNCEKMQGLQNGIYNLTSLQHLKIRNCPSILSFPKEGFPTNLTILSISHLKITETLFDWGLDNLTLLNQLDIGGCQHLLSFPEMKLPTFLRSLHISHLPNLKCLSSEGFRKLPFLETLCIIDCKNLVCFPEDGLPPSLLYLHISNCQKLRSFPRNGLPHSLQQLRMVACPLLKEHCKKGQSRGWQRIADIPYIAIDGKYIYDTEKEL